MKSSQFFVPFSSTSSTGRISASSTCSKVIFSGATLASSASNRAIRSRLTGSSRRAKTSRANRSFVPK
jgi:hypothetical protein